jgi:hypothetical protein
VPALSINGDAKRVGVGVVDARHDTYLPDRQLIAYVQCDGHVGSRKAREQAIVKHSLRAADGLLRRLSNQHESAIPGTSGVRQNLSSAHQARHVQVMTARMSNRDIRSLIVLRANFACKRQTGLFFHWKGVQLSPKHDDRPRTVFHDRNHAGTTYVLGHSEADAAQIFRKPRSRKHFMCGQFRMLVQLHVQRLRNLDHRVNFLVRAWLFAHGRATQQQEAQHAGPYRKAISRLHARPIGG